MELNGKKVLVLGAGRSGISSARFLAAKGATVALHDKRPVDTWSSDAVELRTAMNVGLLSGEMPSWLLDQIDLVVISPGIPMASIPVRYIERKGGEIIGEVELAYRFMSGRMVGITGSNGKTTTTALVGELLQDAGVPVQIGGNIGTPLIDLVEMAAEDTWTVAELSSFQLETIKDLRPTVGVCLNVTPNHLDRYDSFLDYAAAKHRLFMNQTAEDVAVLNADDEITRSWAGGLKANVVLFSTARELDSGLFLRGSALVCRDGNSERVLTRREDIFLKGLHNVENVLAAFAVGLACGASPDSMRETVREFKGVEHRIEYVDEIRGVRFFNDSKATSVFNDSKATSVDAASKALEALSGDEGKIVLILGGRGKNAPYLPLEPLISRSVRQLVLIGEDAANIREQLGHTAFTVDAADMAQAVKIAFEASQAGDSVLLAPACASFDMFKSFEERGTVFKDEVRKLSQAAISRGSSSR
jgi:UDP-N-acetylmuramoylalanine--D-glutamate ligase